MRFEPLELSEFNRIANVLFSFLVSWIFVKCPLSITLRPVLYSTHLFSSFSLDKTPTIMVDFVWFAAEMSNIKNELTSRPRSLSPSNILKNPFRESMIISDLSLEIFAIIDFKPFRKLPFSG